MKKICGFTLEAIDEATCYLTREGMANLHPCCGADKALRFARQLKWPLLVTAETFRCWHASELAPHIWLVPTSTALYGIRWPWSTTEDDEDYRSLLRGDFNLQAQHLKAFIMLRGKRGNQ